MKQILIAILLLIVLSCTNTEKKKPTDPSHTDKPEAIDITNRAFELVKELALNNYKDTVLLSNAIDLYNKSISIDPTNKVSYTQKANLLCKSGKYKEALNTLEKIVQIYPDFTEAYTSIGFVNDILGNTANAEKIYMNAISQYESRIKSDTNNSYLHLSNIIFLHLMLGNQDSAKMVLKNFPKSDTLEVIAYNHALYFYQNFDHKKFLDAYTKPK